MRKILLASLFFVTTEVFSQNTTSLLSFDMTLDQMADIRLKSNQNEMRFAPSYEMSLEELSKLDFQKVAKESSRLDIGFDLSLEELSNLNLHQETGSINPAYDLPLITLSKLLVKKEYLIDNQLDFPYDLPLESLMKLSLVD